MRAKPVVRGKTPPTEPIYSFRLRHLLAVSCIFGALVWVWPRAQATLTLHNKAVALADYALCLVGPTGIELVKKDPDALLALVRRRILAAMPKDRPIAACFNLAEKLAVEHATLRLHQARAAEIAEYRNDPRAPGRYSLREFRLPLANLDKLSERAWPFIRNGYVHLMQPSSHAKEAAHPAAPPAYAYGSGLPAGRRLYRSTAAYGDTWLAALGSGANRAVLVSKNGGLDWTRGGDRLASDLLDRCVVDDDGRGFTLSRLNDGERIVVSQGPSAPPQVAVLSPSNKRIAGISCDTSGLLAALVEQTKDGLFEMTIRSCPFRQPCSDLKLPDMGDARLYYPADVVRLGGDIILSRVVGGITRTTSSRDEGRSWTPWVVVYDENTTGAERAPFKLLPVGDSVLLYGSAANGQRYPVLVSTDHGASFHAPVSASIAGSVVSASL